jgi:hypothetical protein
MGNCRSFYCSYPIVGSKGACNEFKSGSHDDLESHVKAAILNKTDLHASFPPYLFEETRQEDGWCVSSSDGFPDDLAQICTKRSPSGSRAGDHTETLSPHHRKFTQVKHAFSSHSILIS